MVTAELAARRRLGPRAKASLAVEILASYARVHSRMNQGDIREVVAELRGQTPGAAPGPEELAVAGRLGRAVNRTLSRIPRRSRCLVQSLVLTRMLARRGIDSAIVIGVSSESTFAAHAWVEAESVRLLPGAAGTFSPLVRL